MIKRIVFDVVFFGSLFALPWYATVGMGILGLILFRKFWEVILAGFIIDALYYAPGQKFIGHFGFFIIGAIILFIVFNFIKKKIRYA